MAIKYEYKPLEYEDSIRLLNLKPTPDGKFLGCLSHVRLSDQPDYSALSYVWGNRNGDMTLHLEGGALPVTRQLFGALTTLVTTEMVLWIDQICINQVDIVEKEHQVRRMATIFGSAKIVMGWLGPVQNNSRLAMRFLRGLGALWNLGEPNDIVAIYNRLVHHRLIDHPIELFHPGNLCITAAHHLLQRDWFRRLWIVQEATTASILNLHCGTEQISAEQLFTAVTALTQIRCDPPMEPLFDRCRELAKLGGCRDVVLKGQQLPLLRLATDFCGWQCERDQDRLNALIGIAGQDTSSNFDVSYSMTGPSLYLRFAVRNIQQSGALALLHFAGHGHASYWTASRVPNGIKPAYGCNGDIPSWVPDWRLSKRALPLRSFGSDVQAFSATTGRSTCELAGSCLRVRGLLIDVVVHCGLPYGQAQPRNVYELFGSWFLTMQSHIELEEGVIMFAQTLAMEGRLKSSEIDDLEMKPSNVINCFFHWLDRHILGGSLTTERWQSGIPEAACFGEYAARVCRHRTFFITEKGRLGLGPVRIQPGAMIYLIDSLRTPFAVYKDADEQKLCGECYVNGYMDMRHKMSSADELLQLV